MNEEFFPFFIIRCRKLDESSGIMTAVGSWTRGRVGRQKARRASPLSLQRLRAGADRVYTRVRNKGYNKNTNDGSIFPDDLRTFSQLVVQSLKSMFHYSHIYIYIYERIITYISYIYHILSDKKNQNSVYHRIRIFDLSKKKNKLLRLER